LLPSLPSVLLLLLLPSVLLLLCVCRYGVGGLSVLNACAGCYSEDLPVIFISGVNSVHTPQKWSLIAQLAMSATEKGSCVEVVMLPLPT
jgi:hypothetical protein